jgi:N-acetylneuraminate synthase
VTAIVSENRDLALLQCNTNYTGSDDNFDHIHLNVLRSYRTLFPDLVLGLSDHTPGHSTVLGAIALGGKIIEKHFTDDNSRPGPDHPFAMNPQTWREMVDRTRELERALGDTQKYVSGNEQETVVVQRRCLRAARDLKPGTVLCREHVKALRPAPHDAVFPYDIERVLNRKVRQFVGQDEHFTWTKLE